MTVNVVAPGTMYGERLYQLDVRFGKIFTMGRNTSVHGMVDLFNAPVFTTLRRWLLARSLAARAAAL